MTLEEAWQRLKLKPPFYTRFKCDPDVERKIVEIKNGFMFEENDRVMTCHFLEVIEIDGCFITLFDRTKRRRNVRKN